ncbi:MAG: pantoate--beta-alanine ligase [Chlamydiales bacterium]|jgi:pantoate--beta-alanine ligase
MGISMELKTIRSLKEWKSFRRLLAPEIQVGFVATMGNLHKGHSSLIEKSKNENDLTVISLYVNPTQFNNPEDLTNYPRTLESDLLLAYEAGADIVLIPEYSELYFDDYNYKICEKKISANMEGTHRKGHFDGVLTVVMKFLMLVRPNRAYFGEKDYQQLQVIKGMSEAFFLDIDIIGCPTVRDEKGLAMSSRNNRLSEEEYQQALHFPTLLHSKNNVDEISESLSLRGLEVEYIEERYNRRFGAVKVGPVRLIDNIPLQK